MRCHEIVGPCQPRDAVKQDNDILPIFGGTLGFFNRHLRNLDVPFRMFIKGRTDDFAFDRARDICHLLRTFINQEKNERDFRVVRLDAGGDVLQQRGFPTVRWSDNQPALPLPDRRKQIYHARREFRWIVLQFQLLIGVDRREIVEKGFSLGEVW